LKEFNHRPNPAKDIAMEINKKKSDILFKYKAGHDWAGLFTSSPTVALFSHCSRIQILGSYLGQELDIATISFL